MIYLEGNLREGTELAIRSPEVHERARTRVVPRRTFRIPDDGKPYPLPPGLGTFPLRPIDDYLKDLPKAWDDRGGVFAPVYQAEALWLGFGNGQPDDYPFAFKIGAGRINAVSGKPWKNELDAGERDYVVAPPQPWLDGFCTAKGVIRQFVAMPLGSGYTVEEQITGKATHGGIQIVAYPMKRDRYQRLLREQEEEERRIFSLDRLLDFAQAKRLVPTGEMGLAPGGRMEQAIYADPYGIDAWDQSAPSRCFVSLLNAEQWREITGDLPPTRPPTAADYANAGLPWFQHYGADLEALGGAQALALAKSVAEMAAEKGDQVLGSDGTVNPAKVIVLGSTRARSANHT